MEQSARLACELMKALSNERRLMILCHLAQGEISVGALARRLELPQASLSQQLANLRKDGLVQTRREAQTIHYSLAGGAARRLIETLYEIYCADEGA